MSDTDHAIAGFKAETESALADAPKDAAARWREETEAMLRSAVAQNRDEVAKWLRVLLHRMG